MNQRWLLHTFPSAAAITVGSHLASRESVSSIMTSCSFINSSSCFVFFITFGKIEWRNINRQKQKYLKERMPKKGIISSIKDVNGRRTYFLDFIGTDRVASHWNRHTNTSWFLREIQKAIEKKKITTNHLLSRKKHTTTITKQTTPGNISFSLVAAASAFGEPPLSESVNYNKIFKDMNKERAEANDIYDGWLQANIILLDNKDI